MLRKWCLEMAFNTDMESYWNRFVAVKQESPTPNSVYVNGGALRCVAEPRISLATLAMIGLKAWRNRTLGISRQYCHRKFQCHFINR